MMRTFRSKMKIWSQVALWPVIAAFIGTIFLVWGHEGAGGRGGQGGPNTVLQVNDSEAGSARLQEVERSLRLTYRQYYQERFDEMARGMDWTKMALESIVDEMLIQQEAERLGVQVSDEEIKQLIVNNPPFQKDGRFDQAMYRRVLQANRMTEAQFVSRVYQDMVQTRVQNLIQAPALVTRDEAWEQYQLENEKVSGSAYVLLGARLISEVSEPTDEEIQAQYDANLEEYRLGDQAKLDFVKIPFTNYTKQVTLEPETLQDYYLDHMEDFQVEEQVQARHILVKLEQGADEEVQAAARAKIEGALQRAKAGEDFAELATELSEGPSAPRGGDLGKFGRGRMVPAFEEAAFGTEVGEVSEVVQTQFGFHVIKVEAHEEATTKTEQEAMPEIRKILEEEHTTSMALNDGDALADMLYDAGSLEQAITELGLEGLAVERTDWFEKDAFPRELGRLPDLAAALEEGLMVGEAAPVQTRGNECLVMVMVEERPSHIPPLEEVRTDAIQAIKKQKGADLAQERAGKIHQGILAGESWEQAGAAFELEPQDIDPFGRGSGYIPRIGRSETGIHRLFAAAPDEVLLIVDADVNAGVFKVLEHQDVEESAFDAEYATYRSRLQKRKEQTLMTAWLEQRRSEATIELGRAFEDIELFGE